MPFRRAEAEWTKIFPGQKICYFVSETGLSMGFSLNVSCETT